MSDEQAQLSAKERVLQALGHVTGIEKVEKLILSKLDCEAPRLHEVSEYLLALGGKRMRPMMALLCYALFTDEAPNDQIIDVSAGIELIHAATLLHDDIIDKSPRRRNQTSPYIKFGIPSTLLTGDFLLVRAFSLCAKLDRYIIDETERACVELTEGEILETPLYEESHNLESYLTIVKKKTAALFRLAALSGTHISQADETVRYEMGQFGELLGIAFQILDDILDVVADENLLGKKSGVDILERKPTIVNILWAQTGAPLSQKVLQDPLSDEVAESAFLEESLQHLRENQGPLDESRKIAIQYAEDARRHLANAVERAGNVNQGPLKALEAIVDYTLERVQ